MIDFLMEKMQTIILIIGLCIIIVSLVLMVKGCMYDTIYITSNNFTTYKIINNHTIEYYICDNNILFYGNYDSQVQVRGLDNNVVTCKESN